MKDMSREVSAWLPEISYAPVVFVSSKERLGLDPLLDTVLEVADNHNFRFQTAELNRMIEEATYRRPMFAQGAGSEDLLRDASHHAPADHRTLYQRPRTDALLPRRLYREPTPGPLSRLKERRSGSPCANRRGSMIRSNVVSFEAFVCFVCLVVIRMIGRNAIP